MSTLCRGLFFLHDAQWKARESDVPTAICANSRWELRAAYERQRQELQDKTATLNETVTLKGHGMPAQGSNSLRALLPALETFYTKLPLVLNGFRDAARKIEQDYQDELYQLSQSAKNKRIPAARVAPLPENLKFFNDPIHGVVVFALAGLEAWGPIDEFAFGCRHKKYANADVTVGILKKEGNAQQIYDHLCQAGPKLMKAQFLLWARYYESEGEGGSESFSTISVPQFCGDLGFKVHTNGGYRTEHKQAADQLLTSMAGISIQVEKSLFIEKKLQPFQFEGQLWNIGLKGRTKAASTRWETVLYRYQPGLFFRDPRWHKLHKHLGKIHSAWARLNNDSDEWAMKIAAYLAVVARNNKLEPKPLRIETILSRAYLAQTDDAKKRPSHILVDRFYPAMDKLVKHGIIKSWTPMGINTAEPDMNNTESMNAYHEADVSSKSNSREDMVKIEWPYEDDQRRLKELKTAHIKPKQKRSVRNATKTTEKRENHDRIDMTVGQEIETFEREDEKS